MRKYEAPKELEVSGESILSYIDNIDSEVYKQLVAKHGLEDIDPDQWYPAQSILDLFNDIVAEQGGNTQLFVAIGMRIAEHTPVPPDMAKGEDTLAQLLPNFYQHYVASHRGAELLPVQTIQVDERHYQIVLDANHYYPFDLVYGLVFGFCRRFLPAETDFQVYYDEAHTPYGDYGDKVILNVAWS